MAVVCSCRSKLLNNFFIIFRFFFSGKLGVKLLLILVVLLLLHLLSTTTTPQATMVVPSLQSYCHILQLTRNTSKCSVIYTSAGSLHSSAALSAFPLKYPNHKMDKDVRIRKTVKENNFHRANVVAMMRVPHLLPREIVEDAKDELKTMPLNHHWTRMHPRCLVTSRPRGLVKDWKLSRIVWRHEADYNKLSGVQWAFWR
ncbi:28S ribosomal protein S14, mitochondrial [Hyalella azteca]|uniref:28S ribosomal protein S14, mitochondrial n=1 Tax=Hyalella azteca TaxID=294128 RepID=A0A8B7P3B5_HYAAZ|nr:28S ribosomal protein S14, mitochondrial [Hyalella azteca]